VRRGEFDSPRAVLYSLSMTCLFCKIVSGEIPATKVFEDDSTIAFNDIDPKAPTHVLIIPKNHIASHAHAEIRDEAMLGHLFHVAGEIARSRNLTKGYRLVINTGPDGGQTVEHLHVHLLGGRQMSWPPG
jgi:histidine triad (HIT) family protein